MAKHIKPTINLKNKEINFKIENNILENTTDSNQLSNNNVTSISPLLNGDAFETKLPESEAKISKLIAEINLLKKKVGWINY